MAMATSSVGHLPVHSQCIPAPHRVKALPRPEPALPGGAGWDGVRAGTPGAAGGPGAGQPRGPPLTYLTPGTCKAGTCAAGAFTSMRTTCPAPGGQPKPKLE